MRTKGSVQGERCIKCLGQLYIFFLFHHTPYLGIICPHGAACVKVDTNVDVGNDIMRNVPCYTGGKRPSLRARERPVDVFAIGYITREVEEAVYVDDRHTYDSPAFYFIVTDLKDPADDLHTIDLVAVHSCHQRKSRTGLAGTIHVDWSVNLRVGGKPRNVDVDFLEFTGVDPDVGNG